MAETRASRTSGRPAGKRARGKGRKRTLSLSDGTYLRLTIKAKSKGISASELAERILSAALPEVVITIDGRPFEPVVAAA